VDEKLSAGQATGAASLNVAVFTSPARQGSTPQLALRYDSGAGNGPFGLGWSLTVPAITRKTSKGLPRYEDARDGDVFVLSGVEDLVPLLGEQASGSWSPVEHERTVAGVAYDVRRYRPRVESDFARIERWRAATTGEVHWRTISRANVTSVYGQDASSRISDPNDPSRVFSWLLGLSFDDRGNAVSYVYKGEVSSGVPRDISEANRLVTANRYLKRVRYGNDVPYLPVGGQLGELPSRWCFEVVLDYGEHDANTPTPNETMAWPCRIDPFSSYRAGFEIRTYRTCRRVLMFHDMPELGAQPVLTRSTDLGYTTSNAPGDPSRPAYTLLSSVTQTGWLAQAGGYSTAQLPALQLGYGPLTIEQTPRLADADSVSNLTGTFGGGRERWVDLYGEGLQGVLSEDDGAWYYKRNLSAWNPEGGEPAARFESVAVVGEKPSPAAAGDGREELVLTSLNGDGNLCAVRFAPPSPGWFEHDDDTGWAPFREFSATADIDWRSPHTRFVDLDGDGLADVLITDDDAFSWHRWLPDAGFAPADRTAKAQDEERGPAIVLADQTSSIFLADMSGDGLSDLVRIRCGEVCYWPNLGYGCFGAKVTMDNAPAIDSCDRFDGRRVRLADIDGSGTADLLYCGSRVTLWLNQSGNGWTAGTELTELPQYDEHAQVSVFDLLGAGTAALVWTSDLPGEARRPLQYVNLTGGVKPYLLTSVANGLGARTTLTYAPSTKFFVQDREAGSPWITRLPFPVHVVERVETTEAISRTSHVARYTYHHGYYDGVEREFRGFARVETLDADALPARSGAGAFTATPQQSEGNFQLPPVWTRTWYHTGCLVDGRDIGERLATEYFAGDPHATSLAGPTLPSGLDPEGLREAARALRGSMLREEVYAQDGTPAAVVPYTTREHRHRVDRLQPATGTCYGAFHAWQWETLTCNYERRREDPRVTHELSLAIDAYGNVTRSATVAYPRRAPAYPEQAATWLRYTESDFANVAEEADWQRLGLPVETRGYQLTGISPGASDELYDPDALATAAAAAAVISFEQEADGTAAQRRLLARSRTLYRGDDLSSVLPLGSAQSRAIVDRNYTLRYTAGLLTRVLSSKLGQAELDALLAGPGGFVDLDGDGGRWAPSPRVFYSADPAHPDAAYAQAHFYLPQGTIDAWGNAATVQYDAHDLLCATSTDAAGNVTRSQCNYRVLAPWLVTDANLNRRGVRYDALGMVVATAAMGKLQADGTDEGDHLDKSTPEPAAGDDPTTRLEYELGAFAAWLANPARDLEHPAPAWVRTRARVRHKDPGTPWVTSYAYSDGLGRVALTKTLAEAGEAPQRDAAGRIMRDAAGAIVLGPCPTRWVGSGRVVYDNKGNPVKAYEPFFDSSPAYDDESDLVEWGVTAITRYDPLSRPVRVDNPNATLRTVEFDAWSTAHADENDNVLASGWYAARSGGALGEAEADAAAKAAAHANTPARSDLDPFGRTLRSVADNGGAGMYVTLLKLDIDGRPEQTTDALGRVILTESYDMAGAPVHRVSADAGERWLLADAAGQPLMAWDGRGTRVRPEYDELRRPTNVRVSLAGTPERIAQQSTYGETLPNAQQLNLRGTVYQHRDDSGLVTSAACDFKGNVLSSSRQVLAAYREPVDWGGAPALEADTLTTAKAYDALNRPVTVTAPDGSVSEPVYNERSLLAAMSVRSPGAAAASSYVTAIAYDAKAQRQRLSYGNGAITAYSHDPLTYRLTALKTTRPGGGEALQDLTYTYDPVGNVTRVVDAAQQTAFFANQVVTPSADYTYDAIYRLISATGREHAGKPIGWSDDARIAVLASDGQAMRGYTQTFAYDAVGNFQELIHSAGGAGFRRTYAYDEPEAQPRNNRLTSTTVGGIREPYSYDVNGNISSMPHLSLMRWDWQDKLEATARQVVSEGTPRTTYYSYGASGERVRKTTDNAKGVRVSQRVYDGDYELYREYAADGSVKLERHSRHVSDGAGRICLLETTTVDVSAPGAALPATLARYQLGNLLGSAVLELDASGAIISYEEYYPYGSTSFQAGRSAAEASLKRYRYTGKERDEESGFYYHGARYHACWLGRWVQPDPAGLVEGSNPFVYVRDQPVSLRDPSGMQAENSPEDLFQFLRNQAAFQFGKRQPQVVNTEAARAGASRFGMGAQKEIEDVLSAVKSSDQPFLGVERVYSEVAVQHGTDLVTKIGGTPLRGHRNIDLLMMPKGTAPLEAGKSRLAAGAAELVGDVKHGGGSVTASHAALGRRGGVTVGVAVKPGPGYVPASGASPAAGGGITSAKSGVSETRAELSSFAKGEVRSTVEALKETRSAGKQLATTAAETALKTDAKIGLKEGAKVLGTKVAKLVPFVGIGVGAGLVAADLRTRDYGAAALDTLEAIPVVGDVVAAGHLGVSAGTALNQALGIEAVAAEHGAQFESAARRLGLSEDTSRIIGALGAGLSSITVAPSEALERSLAKWIY
jgi:RHS repeat-associated protein